MIKSHAFLLDPQNHPVTHNFSINMYWLIRFRVWKTNDQIYLSLGIKYLNFIITILSLFKRQFSPEQKYKTLRKVSGVKLSSLFRFYYQLYPSIRRVHRISLKEGHIWFEGQKWITTKRNFKTQIILLINAKGDIIPTKMCTFFAPKSVNCASDMVLFWCFGADVDVTH